MSITKFDFVFTFICHDKINLKKKLTKVGVNFSFTLRGLGTDWGRYFEIGTRTKGFTQSPPNFEPSIPHRCSLALCIFLFSGGVNWRKKWRNFAILGWGAGGPQSADLRPPNHSKWTALSKQ